MTRKHGAARGLRDLPFTPFREKFEPIRSGDILVMATVRNEAKRLASFLDHYRRLGVARFFIVDNDSTDSTPAILASADDVVPFHTSESYLKSKCGRLWTDALRNRFGRGHWCLTLDADEFLCFPAMEHLDLHDLTSYCDRHGYEGLFTLLLDMYPEGPLDSARLESGESPTSAFPFFDPAGYNTGAAKYFPPLSIYGGVRRRVFGQDQPDAWFASLRKTPLIRWRDGISYRFSTHAHSPIRFADITGILLHFKFTPDFAEFVTAEFARGERPTHDEEYASYARVASANPSIVLSTAESERFADTAQLVRLGLMKSSLRFVNDNIPAFRKRLDRTAAEEFRLAHKAALEAAAARFRPDARQLLQIWDAFTRPAKSDR